LCVNNDTVRRWGDNSPVANHGNQTTSGSRPIFKTGIRNGHPALLFDGTDDCLLLTSFGLTDFSAFIACSQTGDNGWMGRTSANEPQLRMGQSAASKISTFDGTNNPQSSTLGVALGNWSVLEYLRSSSTVSFYQNGTAYGTGTFSLTPANFDEVGAVIVNAIPVNGYIGEIVVYDSALNATDRGLVETYLLSRW